MWTCFFIMAGLGGLFFLSGNVQIPEEVRCAWYRKPFYKGASLLASCLQRLKPESQREREIQKLEAMLVILFCGLTAMIVLDGTAGKGEKILKTLRIERPDRGQGDSAYHFQAQIEDVEELQEVNLKMRERQYTDQEKDLILQQAKEELEKLLIGENPSKDEVREKVFLPSALQRGEVSVQWIQSPEGLLDAAGKITEELPSDGEILNLTALLNCDGREMNYETALHLMPRLRSREEQLGHDLKRAVAQAEKDSSQQDSMTLPDQVDGKKVTWMNDHTSLTGGLLAIVICLAAAGYFGKEAELKREEADRRRELLLEYPDVLFKLGMLLGAGLTIQNAFVKVAKEYQESKERDQKAKPRWAYEEMLAACNEMHSGIAEAKAYENFGRRCGETCYIRLGSTLSGGLQKSAEGMTALLLEEADAAMEERRQLARKLGEEAGTKLLFPMILMLMVVLVILMVPAVMAF